MPNIGPLEIAIVLVIVLIVFGPKRLPELGKSLGEGIRGFRGSLSGEDDKDSTETKKAELQAATQQPAPTPPPAATEQPAAEKPVEGEVITENKG
ncbi:MAG: sec-independent protein translocase protein TatA [Solirubrobacterales bacterium]|jgi:sec-independent protein translocase protein TatA|nr:sec-independent protein translocase protein TatA [Solirubrobacterales bacterium]